ncbi:hypothetical protein QZH41_012497, partial [Actinostola sp. cb2023]
PCAIAFAFPWSELMNKFHGEIDAVSPGQLAFVQFSLGLANDELTEWTRYVCSDWIYMDVKIASWLLDPDNPPKEYSELLQKVDLKLVPKEDGDEDELLRLDLSTLGPAVLTLYNRLKAKELWDLYWSLEMPLCPILA